MDFTEFIHYHYYQAAESKYFGPVIRSRIDKFPPQLDWKLVLLLIIVAVTPNMLICYVLRRYKFLHIRSYAAIRDYLLMTIWIFFITSIDIFIKAQYTLIQDFISIILPMHTTLIMHMINPSFNKDYVLFNVTLVWKVTLVATFSAYLGVISTAHYDTIRLIRLFFIAVNTVILLGVPLVIYADIVRDMKKKLRDNPSSPRFWFIFNNGGFPRFQIGLIHLFHWMTYVNFMQTTNIYFLYPLAFVSLTGWTCLLSLAAHNDYFFNCFVHLLTFKKVRRCDRLPDNAHYRYTLEAQHVWSRE